MPDYFEAHYEDLRLPIAADDKPGLRSAQLGAIHAIGAHFTLRTDPAVITMPTGSGKTAVITVAPFLLRATRVLVVTPSQLVRSQVADQFKDLAKLKELRVLDVECETPRVSEVKKQLTSQQGWTELEDFDVVVGTPYSVSPGMDAIPAPPPELFDLVLVDEAHHSPARIWNEIFLAFPHAKRVLFTATPFRRDAREIRGRFVYTYPISEAYKEGIVGEISYIAVTPQENVAPDVSIAKAAERTLAEDRKAGFDHALMIRTDSRKRADELEQVYRDNTGLRLKTIHSGHSFRHAKNAIAKLRKKDLDGVICVDMMGEGFDFPELKIAAVHSPHKSLAVTLQFIGRFIRTNAGKLGTAKFLAVPSDIEVEAERLYQEHASWQKIVPNLLQSKIEDEITTRTALSTFESIETNEEREDSEIQDISLYALRPYHHVKVFRSPLAPDYSNELLLGDVEVTHREQSEDLDALVAIIRARSRPEWTALPGLETVEHHLLVVHYHFDTQLLFICSSLREDWVYESVAISLVGGPVSPLPPDRIYQALNGLEDFEFFNVGMRNRTLASNSESYRIIAGSAAQRAISKSDGQLYHRGHSYGKAKDGDKEVTLGLSTGSKIWSNRWAQIPQLIAWCDDLALRMSSATLVKTQSELDFLQTATEALELPEGPIAATWPLTAYTRPLLLFSSVDGEPSEQQLLDIDFRIDQERSTTDRIRLVVEGEDIAIPITFGLRGERLFELEDDGFETITIGTKTAARPLVQHLNSEPPTIFFADGSSLEGRMLTPPPPDDFLPFDVEKIEVVDWDAANVDVESEVSTTVEGKVSIQGFIEQRLANSDANIVFFDDGPGEAADFVAIWLRDDSVEVELYHCKSSGGDPGGDRVKDVYDVCGQAEKSILITRALRKLESHMKRRVKRKAKRPSRFIRGDLNAVSEVVRVMRLRRVVSRIYIVQPGITKSELTPKIASVLASASDWVRRAGGELMAIGAT